MLRKTGYCQRVFLSTILSLATLGLATPCFATSPALPSPALWSQHSGAYIGTRIGFNFVAVTLLGSTSDRHGAVTQELMGGYFFQPNWALETGVGSYFSSLGLGIRLGIKRLFPLSNHWNFSLQVGGNYISTFLDNGLIGPYASASVEYSLNQHIAVNLEASDIISSASIFNNNEEVSGNIFSMIVGFTYYLNN